MPSEMKRLKQLEKREQASQDHCGRSVFGQRDASGCDSAKAMKPARRKQAVEHLQTAWRISIRHACRTLMAARSTFYYKPHHDAQAVLRKRVDSYSIRLSTYSCAASA